MKKVLLTATVQSHIAQFHLPLIEMLKEKGYEVHVAARNNLAEKNGLKLETPDKIFDIPFDRWPMSRKNLKAYQQIKAIIGQFQYERIHCNTPMGGVVTRLAARASRKRGTRVFYTAHGFHFYKGAPLINWLVYYPIEKWLAHYTDQLITITKEDYELALRKFRTKVCRIHGVGANSKRYFPYPKDEIERIKRELGYTDKEFLLLCTGELNKNKNQSTLIQALAKIQPQNPNIKLLLAGNGPKEQELKDLVNEMGLQKSVEFLGYRTDLEKYVNICDVLISMSYREGLPLNIMEAMLCEKPVIASINRGHLELIQKDVTGYLIGAEDVNALSNKILMLFKNQQHSRTLGVNGKMAGQVYSAENVIHELMAVYEGGFYG